MVIVEYKARPKDMMTPQLLKVTNNASGFCENCIQ